MSTNEKTSRIPGFYELCAAERRRLTAAISKLNELETRALIDATASSELSDIFIENAIGVFALPLGIATNFVIDGEEVLIPMAVEESSVLAAASFGAKLARAGGGFKTKSSEPIMTGQVQIKLNDDVDFDTILRSHEAEFIEYLNRGHEKLVNRGGGAKSISWRWIAEIRALVIHIDIHTCDAMGANIVNTMCEKLATFIPDLFPGSDVGLRILSNLCLGRLASAECFIPPSALGTKNFSGGEVVERVVEAYKFADHDIFRAATHNKGVMNGIDPLVIATGNDWRAVEAGAHAFAAKDGRYKPMTLWAKTLDGGLFGRIELPMALGTVGGVTRLHPTAQSALKILGFPSARRLAEIAVAVGLAQNLSALRALATEGIQPGHMGLHQKNIDLLMQRGFH